MDKYIALFIIFVGCGELNLKFHLYLVNLA